LVKAFVEPLFLYGMLFFVRFGGTLTLPEPLGEFSAFKGVPELLTRTLPCLFLVWFFLLRKKSAREWGVAGFGRRDMLSGVVALPSIVVVGFATALAALHFGGNPPLPPPAAPGSVLGWAMLGIWIFGAAYLEESYFRFYLLSKRSELGLGPHAAVLLSTLMFALCHLYMGPWGLLNAALSGAALCYVFLKFGSLHGIAIAHGVYNIAVYAMGGPASGG